MKQYNVDQRSKLAILLDIIYKGDIDTMYYLANEHHQLFQLTVNKHLETIFTNLSIYKQHDMMRILFRALQGAKDFVGKTWLHCASEGGDVRAVEILLDHGANIGAGCIDADGDRRWTPLHIAVLCGYRDIACLLAASGADITMDDWPYWFTMNSTFSNIVHCLVAGGVTLLHLAVRTADLRIMGSLIRYGVNIDAQDDAGVTPLLDAVSHRHRCAIDMLLAAGAQVDLADNTNRTPLHEAAYHERADIITGLATSANVDIRDDEGNTPLHIAAGRFTNVARRLIHLGASVNATNVYGQTPLHLVKNNLSTLDFLIERGADVNARDNTGATPLLYAVDYGKLEAVRLLVTRGADVNIPSNFLGVNYPICQAALAGRLDIIKALAVNDLDVNPSGSDGTPLNCAIRRQHLDVVIYLVKTRGLSGSLYFIGQAHGFIETTSLFFSLVCYC